MIEPTARSELRHRLAEMLSLADVLGETDAAIRLNEALICLGGTGVRGPRSALSDEVDAAHRAGL